MLIYMFDVSLCMHPVLTFSGHLDHVVRYLKNLAILLLFLMEEHLHTSTKKI